MLIVVSNQDVFDGIRTVGNNYRRDSGEAWTTATCADCGGDQMAVIATADSGEWMWLRCVRCLNGSVSNLGVVSPGAQPFSVPAGLPEAERRTWAEVRGCLSVGAWSAAVTMCRKLLLHLAVANGLAAKGARDRAPGFVECVNHLESEGVITKKMRPWVDRIKDVGNDANHELEPIDERQAMDVAGFAFQLLKLSYEMDTLVNPPSGADD